MVAFNEHKRNKEGADPLPVALCLYGLSFVKELTSFYVLQNLMWKLNDCDPDYSQTVLRWELIHSLR
jgi:hypothetical protein